MKTRAELLEEKRAKEQASRPTQEGSAPAWEDGFLRCGSCKTKQKPRADGLCMACGVALADKPSPSREPDPATLRPDSAETQAAMSKGAVVHGLKDLGFDVTLVIVDSWADKFLQSARECVTNRGNPRPIFLDPYWKGPGKVPGADAKDRGREVAAEKPKAVQILEQKGVEVVTSDLLAGTPTVAPLEKQTTIEAAIVKKQQPMGSELGTMTQLLGMLHSLGSTDVTLRDIGKWEPGSRKAVFEVCERAIAKKLPFRFSMDADRMPMFVGTLGDGLPTPPPPSEEGTIVTVPWGEEKFTPVKDSYSTVSVGPFLLAKAVGPGETIAGVYSFLLDKLTAMAEAERDRKIRSFVAALKGAVKEARS